MCHPQTWEIPTASSLSPPSPQLLDRSPQASPWSKKSRITSHSMKMITSPQLAASPPEHLTKVNKLLATFLEFCLVYEVKSSFLSLYGFVHFCRCSHFKNCIASPTLVSRDGQKPHWPSAIPVQYEKASFQPVCVWNIL